MKDNEMGYLEKEIAQKATAAISDAIAKTFEGYHNNPLRNICEKVVNKHSGKLESIIDGAVNRLVYSADFDAEINSALNKMLARLLIEKIGGELEKSVNKLKQDPTTRAKITVAIDKIINESR